MNIKDNQILINEIRKLLQLKENVDLKITKFKKRGLANDVYELRVNKEIYIIKKYNYNYDFELSRKLYDIYDKNGINNIQPINKNVIEIENVKYNIFKYLSNTEGIIKDSFIIDLIKVNRKVNNKANLIEKCDYYYNYLLHKNKHKLEEVSLVMNEYNKLKLSKIFNDKYINHGDLSKSNILFHKKAPYIIDFDETIITTELYDFAVMMIKLKTDYDNFKYDEIRNIILKLNLKYAFEDYKSCIKMYLCKILLEKFYLYEIGKIDLFDNEQIKDNYKRYVKLLEGINII